MTNINSFMYSIVLSGKTRAGFEKSQVINQLADLFKTSPEKIALWFTGEPTIIKRNIDHKKAFSYQVQLEQCGAEVSLIKTPVPKEAVSFTMVPDGEELTPFKELEQRLNNGELVACNHCEKRQSLAPYCSECGKPLIAKIVPQIENHNNKSLKIKLISLLAILIVIWVITMF